MTANEETAITIAASDAVLEARIRTRSQSRAVIVTHPHPLYGGDMNNNVVAAVADAFGRQGWSTLRFNFRGVGQSTGQYADGLGEQDDVQAAIDYLKTNGFQTIDLAGYSFGAWVLAGWSRNQASDGHRLFLVAPPVAFVDFDLHTPIPGLHHVFTGSLDDLAPPEPIRSALPQWHPDARFTIIEGADHFFRGQTQTLQNAISAAFG